MEAFPRDQGISVPEDQLPYILQPCVLDDAPPKPISGLQLVNVFFASRWSCELVSIHPYSCCARARLIRAAMIVGIGLASQVAVCLLNGGEQHYLGAIQRRSKF